MRTSRKQFWGAFWTLAVVLAGLIAWFFGNLLYSLFWKLLGDWGFPITEAQMIGYICAHLVPFVLALLAAAILALLVRNQLATAGFNEPHIPDTPPAQAPSVEYLRQAKIFINLQITTAQSRIESLCLKIIEAVRTEQNSPFGVNIKRGTIELLQSQYGRLLRVSQGIDVAAEQQIQHLFGWYWNEYRLTRHFILAAIESGLNLGKITEAKSWLDADRQLISALKMFAAEPENETLRRSLMSSGWDDPVTEMLNEKIR